MNRHNTGVKETLANKLRRAGAVALSDVELLTLVLGRGANRDGVDQTAEQLMRHFGSLTAVLKADSQRLMAQPGVGGAAVALICGALELGRRQALETMSSQDVLSNPEATRRFLQFHLSGRAREVFSCIFLDSQHQVIRCDDLFFGTLDGAAVYPREVAVRALQYRAAAVILAHNHPSGIADPSAADKRITERLQSALSLLDIRVLDHLIIGTGKHYSFAEAGLL